MSCCKGRDVRAFSTSGYEIWGTWLSFARGRWWCCFVQHVESMCLFILNQEFDRHTEHIINLLHGAATNASRDLSSMASKLNTQASLLPPISLPSTRQPPTTEQCPPFHDSHGLCLPFIHSFIENTHFHSFLASASSSPVIFVTYRVFHWKTWAPH